MSANSNSHYRPYRKYLTPIWRMVGWGRYRFLFVRPEHRAYGRFIADLAVSMWVCLQENARLIYLKPKDPKRARVNLSLLNLECEGIKIVSGNRLLQKIFIALWKALEIWERIVNRLGSFRHNDLNESYESINYPPYVPRRLLNAYLPTYLPDKLERQAEEVACRTGWSTECRIVTLHVRESGHDFDEQKDVDTVSWRKRRNATIENYIPAIDYLVAEGFSIVRMGDTHMEPFQHPGVVDLPYVEGDYGLLELYAMMRSEFFIATDSGPYYLPFLTGTPMLMTNATLWWINFPLRKSDMYILKHIVDRTIGRQLNLNELLSIDFTVNDTDLNRFDFIENSDQEILDAVVEMYQLSIAWGEQNAEQKAYYDSAHEMIKRVAEEAGTHPRIEGPMQQWGPDRGFLGYGRIAASYLGKWGSGA